MVSNTFLFSPRKLGKWSNLTNIFQMGWFNHQLVYSRPFRGVGFPVSISRATYSLYSWGFLHFRYLKMFGEETKGWSPISDTVQLYIPEVLRYFFDTPVTPMTYCSHNYYTAGSRVAHSQWQEWSVEFFWRNKKATSSKETLLSIPYINVACGTLLLIPTYFSYVAFLQGGRVYIW